MECLQSQDLLRCRLVSRFWNEKASVVIRKSKLEVKIGHKLVRHASSAEQKRRVFIPMHTQLLQFVACQERSQRMFNCDYGWLFKRMIMQLDFSCGDPGITDWSSNQSLQDALYKTASNITHLTILSTTCYQSLRIREICGTHNIMLDVFTLPTNLVFERLVSITYSRNMRTSVSYSLALDIIRRSPKLESLSFIRVPSVVIEQGIMQVNKGTLSNLYIGQVLDCSESAKYINNEVHLQKLAIDQQYYVRRSHNIFDKFIESQSGWLVSLELKGCVGINISSCEWPLLRNLVLNGCYGGLLSYNGRVDNHSKFRSLARLELHVESGLINFINSCSVIESVEIFVLYDSSMENKKVIGNLLITKLCQMFPHLTNLELPSNYHHIMRLTSTLKKLKELTLHNIPSVRGEIFDMDQFVCIQTYSGVRSLRRLWVEDRAIYNSLIRDDGILSVISRCAST